MTTAHSRVATAAIIRVAIDVFAIDLLVADVFAIDVEQLRRTGGVFSGKFIGWENVLSDLIANYAT